MIFHPVFAAPPGTNSLSATLLAAMLLPAMSRAKESARATQCLNNLRQLGLALRLYADDSADEFPRSQHSAFANGLMPWERTIAPLLGSITVLWTNLLTGVYHCPGDKKTAVELWNEGTDNYCDTGHGTGGTRQEWRFGRI